MNGKPDNSPPAYASGPAVLDSDLATLKKAMIEAHPDRGGTDDAFIEARKTYLTAKWLREATEAVEEERRQREAAEATARFRRRTALVICASAAVLLAFAAVALYKKYLVMAGAGRQGELAATGTRPPSQLVLSNPYGAAPDSPQTMIEGAFASEPWPAATAAIPGNSTPKGDSTPKEDSARKEEADATIQTAAARPSTPEQQAKFVVHAAMDAASTGSIDGTSRCYADAVNYYSKRMSKPEVIADKMKLWERWPARNYTLRPDSLTASCTVIGPGRMWMNCSVKGVFDWEAANSSKRSVGSASITYTLIGLSNSDPLDLRIVDENSTVITRTITDIGRPRSPLTAAPG
jgi:hypothetical protein